MKKVTGMICVALLAAFSTVSAANAKVCKDEVYASGKASLTKVPGAYLSSLWAWRREAESKFGVKFRAWRNAKNRNIDCQKGTKNGKSGWICTRTAVACSLIAAVSNAVHHGSDLMLPDRTLRRGDQGPDVRILQRLLNEAGYDVTVDGNYGHGTQHAVKDFQRKEGISVDGSVGPQTRERFRKFMNG